uniref:Uncharacterized protein n=1 Tax=Lepeophtheirus salmonis TaxID=72036 RepID=A0A0K2ULV7_LEPSM
MEVKKKACGSYGEVVSECRKDGITLVVL